MHYKLFLSEIIIALQNQHYGGAFVVKFFDIYTTLSLDLLYVLSEFYHEITICKPLTSRPTNSEKYIICKGFRKLTKQRKKIIINLLNILPDIDEYSTRILDINIPDEFVDFIKTSNEHYMYLQINSIQQNLYYIEKQNFNISRNNERKQWLTKYQLL